MASPRRWPYAVAISVLTAAAIVLGGMLWRASPPHPLMRFGADLGPEALDDGNSVSSVVVSPDGGRLAYFVQVRGGPRHIATRLLDEAAPTLLAGTEHGSGVFFSPDGQWLGFFADGKMKKISIHGGPVTTLCDAANSRGASWGPHGYIVANLTLGGGLFRVPEGGGNPEALTDPKATGEATHRWPQVLPGGRGGALHRTFHHG
jgi:hypothetical protein